MRQRHAPRIVASACGDGYWPPNTIEGCRRCLDLQVDAIEIDVQLSAEGHVIVHHDFRLNPNQTRLNGAWISKPTPLIKDLSLSELRAFDVGRTRPGCADALRYAEREAIDGARIPALSEIIETLKLRAQNPATLIVELKTNPQVPRESADPTILVERTIATLDDGGICDHAEIIAFDWRVLRIVQQIHPSLPTGYLNVPKILEHRVQRLPTGDSPWFDGYDPRHYGGSVPRAISAAGGSQWSAYFADLTPANVAEARNLGLSVAAWGLQGTEEILQMRDFGLDGITVAQPERAVAPKP
jgi:glycerophosphoryl diester phosphodiesterase